MLIPESAATPDQRTCEQYSFILKAYSRYSGAGINPQSPMVYLPCKPSIDGINRAEKRALLIFDFKFHSPAVMP